MKVDVAKIAIVLVGGVLLVSLTPDASAQFTKDGIWSPAHASQGALQFYKEASSNPTQELPTVILVNDQSQEMKWMMVFDPRECPDTPRFSRVVAKNDSALNGRIEIEYCRGTRMNFKGNMPFSDFIDNMNAGNLYELNQKLDIYFHKDAQTVDNLSEAMQALQIMRAHHGNLFFGGVVYAPNSPRPYDLISAITNSSIKYYGGESVGYFTQAIKSPFGGYSYYIERALTDIKCTPISSGGYTCSYTLFRKASPDRDSLWGTFLSAGEAMAGNNGSHRWTNTFVKTNGVWASPTLDAAYAQAKIEQQRQIAQQQTSRQSPSVDTSFLDKLKKDEDDRQSRFEAICNWSGSQYC